jgi:CheY-specific phosphatase CheX
MDASVCLFHGSLLMEAKQRQARARAVGQATSRAFVILSLSGNVHGDVLSSYTDNIAACTYSVVFRQLVQQG